MELASLVCSSIGADLGKVNRNTVEAWLRSGILTESMRTDRNRLFSGLDVALLAVVYYCSIIGLNKTDVLRDVTAAISKQFASVWNAEGWEALGDSFVDISRPMDSRGLLAITVQDGSPKVEVPDSNPRVQELMRIGVITVINWYLFFSLAMRFGGTLGSLKQEKLASKGAIKAMKEVIEVLKTKEVE